MKNWSYIVFRPNQPNEGGSCEVTQIPDFLKNGSLTTDFSETWHDNLLRMIVFLKFLSQAVLLKEGRGVKTPSMRVLTASSTSSFIGYWWNLAGRCESIVNWAIGRVMGTQTLSPKATHLGRGRKARGHLGCRISGKWKLDHRFCYEKVDEFVRKIWYFWNFWADGCLWRGDRGQNSSRNGFVQHLNPISSLDSNKT